jgi:hypothetical protein
MNNKILVAVSISAICFLSSCLTGLHNLVSYKNVATDDRLIGNWQYVDLVVNAEAVPQSRLFKEAASTAVKGEVKKSPYDSKEDSMLYSKSYILEFTRNDHIYYMACCLTRIGSGLYADFEPLVAKRVGKPATEDITDLFNEQGYLTCHSIAKVIVGDNRLEFRLLNSDFIQNQLNNGTIAIKYEHDELFGTTLITASPGELRQFLSKYGDDERLYSSKNTITLNKILE